MSKGLVQQPLALVLERLVQSYSCSQQGLRQVQSRLVGQARQGTGWVERPVMELQRALEEERLDCCCCR